MAVTLLFNRTKSQIGSLELDVTVSEQHSADVEATDHPVEKGAATTDHLRAKPETVTLDAMVTNTPFKAPNDPTVTRTQGAYTFNSNSEMQPARAGEAWQKLLELKDAGELVTLVTARRTYTDMAIISLSVPIDARTGQALRFSATFKQVKVVESREVVVTEVKAKGKKDLGGKAALTAPEATKRKSLLKSVKDTGVVQHAADKLNNFLFFLR